MFGWKRLGESPGASLRGLGEDVPDSSKGLIELFNQ